ncbi:DNA-binding protein [Lacisediminihabitans profunda]|uniref:DNA-binding protein n=1 Tax=Lacisediminihabitans profunda TaxID=2594790 RepID=A0A5C8UJR2_9MICO|nr:DNA-binding protein [Lacisediminihabitans profunda]TXN28446.1 DNA-binding protein [Lacisediminihabitans profunda]
MFVVTADQVDSRNRPDIADETIRTLTSSLRDGLMLPVDRTAGDEIQMLVKDAHHALAAILSLSRDGQWSVGCGVGGVSTPLPANAREAGGPAFVAARAAVNDAKKRDTRFALRGDSGIDAGDAEALVDLLLQLRGRRSPEGWEIYDLMSTGSTQADAAKRLGITPQAASKRARAAAIRAEFAAVVPLERVLAATDDSAIAREEP